MRMEERNKYMDNVELYQQEPCKDCIHYKVCGAKEHFRDTEIKTKHPFAKITIECTEYLKENDEN